MQHLASIQPRTSLVKFARSPRTDHYYYYRSPRYDSGGEHKQNRIYDRLEALEEKAESMKENLQLSARKFTEGEKAMRAELPSWVRHRHRRESFLETDSPESGDPLGDLSSNIAALKQTL